MQINNGTINPIDDFKKHKRTLENNLSNIETNSIINVQMTKNDEEPINDERKYKTFVVFSLEHQKANSDVVYSISSDPVIAAMNCIHQIIKKRDCHHEWTQKKDPFGDVYCDGRGICLKCNDERVNVTPLTPGSVISVYKGDDVVAKENWPSSSTLQGGHSGIVLKKEGNYETSFVEAYPEIDGIGAFIRGEGQDILSAEQDCYKKYKKMTSCKDHEWSRETRNGYHTNGLAECKKCGLSGQVFKPVTQCQKCDKETTRMLGDRHICLEHQYSMTREEFIDIQKDLDRVSIFSNEKNGEKELASLYFQFPIIKSILEKYGEDFYERNSSVICSLLIELESKVADALPNNDNLFIETFEMAKSTKAKVITNLFISQIERVLGNIHTS